MNDIKELKEKDLFDYFRHFGPLRWRNVNVKPGTGGKFAVVKFETDAAGEAVLEQRLHTIRGQSVIVSKSKKEKLVEQVGGQAAMNSLNVADPELRLIGNFTDFKGTHSSVSHLFDHIFSSRD